MRYFFILGKNEELSLAELIVVLNANTHVIIQSCAHGVALIESKAPIDLPRLQERLGGIIKCGEIMGEISAITELPNLILSFIGSGTEKFHFGFSVYTEKAGALSNRKQLHALGIIIKRRLAEKKIPSRFVTSREPALSSVIVRKEKLLEGMDACIIDAGRGRWIVGRTRAAQDFKSYGERDFGRPGRDDLSGMLPPKLAKIMINLSAIATNGALLDPFCGSGTILQEALLLGYTHLVGSDMEKKAIDDTRRNLAWLHNKKGLDITEVRVFQGEVERLTSFLPDQLFDAIVTEPYLGPALRGRETVSDLLKTKRGLEELYLSAFAQYVQILKPNGRVVMVLPVFVTSDSMMFMDIVDDIKKMGFSVINPLATVSERLAPPATNFRWPLMYYREGQRVYREIWIFEKK